MVKTPPLTIDDRAFLKALKRIETTKREAAGHKIVEKVGKSAMRRSRKLTPVDEGDLKDSHTLDISTEDGEALAIITVSDPAAWYVHEQLENRHPHGGQSKFLRDAFRQRRNLLQKTMREVLSDLIRDEGLA